MSIHRVIRRIRPREHVEIHDDGTVVTSLTAYTVNALAWTIVLCVLAPSPRSA